MQVYISQVELQSCEERQFMSPDNLSEINQV